jgi:hypothetical protein
MSWKINYLKKESKRRSKKQTTNLTTWMIDA